MKRHPVSSQGILHDSEPPGCLQGLSEPVCTLNSVSVCLGFSRDIMKRAFEHCKTRSVDCCGCGFVGLGCLVLGGVSAGRHLRLQPVG